jgi:hypothetical protein
MPSPWIGLLGLLLTFAPGTGNAGEAVATDAAALEDVLILQVDGELDIDANGRVGAYRITTPVPDAVRAGLDRGIPAWTFEPRFAGEAITPVTVEMQIS